MALSFAVGSKLHGIHRPQVHRARHGQPLELPALGDGGDLQGSPGLAEGPGLAAFPAAQGLPGGGCRSPGGTPAGVGEGGVLGGPQGGFQGLGPEVPDQQAGSGALRLLGQGLEGGGQGGLRGQRAPLLQRPRHPGEEEAVPPLSLAGLHLGEGEVQGGLAGEGIDLGGEGLRPPVPLHRHLALPADLPGHGEGEGGLAEDLPAAEGGGRLHPHHAPLGGGGEEGHLAGGQLPDGQQPAGEVGVRPPGHGGVDQEEGLPGGVDQLKGQVHGIPSFLACPWAVEPPGRPGKICHDCSTNPSVGKG